MKDASIDWSGAPTDGLCSDVIRIWVREIEIGFLCIICSLLASVSDDTHVMIWDAFRHRRLTDLQTLHFGNIFAVRFMPNSGDCRLATGAADNKVHVCDVHRGGDSPIWSCECHEGRVKSIAVCPDDANMLWTSGEDGFVL